MPPPTPPPPPYTANPLSPASQPEVAALRLYEAATALQQKLVDEAIAKKQREMVRELAVMEKRVIAKMDAVMGKMKRLESTVVGRTQRTESIAQWGFAGGESDSMGYIILCFMVALLVLWPHIGSFCEVFGG